MTVGGGSAGRGCLFHGDARQKGAQHDVLTVGVMGNIAVGKERLAQSIKRPATRRTRAVDVEVVAQRRMFKI